MREITIISPRGDVTTARVINETPKALLLKNSDGEAWFPRRVINAEGTIAHAYLMHMDQAFLFRNATKKEH